MSAMPCSAKQGGRRAHLRRFAGDRLGAIFAKLGGLAIAVGIGPGAARAIESILLVQLEQRAHAASRAHLRQAVPRGLVDGIEAGGRLVPLLDSGAFRSRERLGTGDASRGRSVGVGGLLGVGLSLCAVSRRVDAGAWFFGGSTDEPAWRMVQRSNRCSSGDHAIAFRRSASAVDASSQSADRRANDGWAAETP